MAQSDEWRDLADQFRALWRIDTDIAAIWNLFDDKPEPHWGLVGINASIAQFQSLATRAGLILEENENLDPVDVWLEKLSKRGLCPREKLLFPVTASWSGLGFKISELCKGSGILCSELERDELIRARRIGLEIPKVASDAQPLAAAGGPIWQQLEALRLEARITQDQLSELVSLDIRTVQRHLSPTGSKPSKLNLAAYQREFSKLLEKHVVIVILP